MRRKSGSRILFEYKEKEETDLNPLATDIEFLCFDYLIDNIYSVQL